VFLSDWGSGSAFVRSEYVPMRSLDEGNALMRWRRPRVVEAEGRVEAESRWVFECPCGCHYVRRKDRLIAEVKRCQQAGVDLYL
jgi:hypothetical protein